MRQTRISLLGKITEERASYLSFKVVCNYGDATKIERFGPVFIYGQEFYDVCYLLKQVQNVVSSLNGKVEKIELEKLERIETLSRLKLKRKSIKEYKPQKFLKLKPNKLPRV